MATHLTIDELQLGKLYVTVESKDSLVTLVQPVVNKSRAKVYFLPKSELMLDYGHFDSSTRFVEIKA